MIIIVIVLSVYLYLHIIKEGFYAIMTDTLNAKKQEIIKNIDFNLAITNNILKLKDNYPFLYKILKRRIHYLNNFLDYAKGKCKKPLYIYNNGTYIIYFFGSVKYFALKYTGYYTTWNRNLNLFAVLGLITKIDNKKIKLKYSKEVDEYSRNMKAKKINTDVSNIKPVNYYSIPMYSAQELDDANKIAQKLYENNFRVNALSKIYIIKFFGQEFADKIFPDNRTITKYSYYVKNQIEKRILKSISQNGYTTKDEIINKTYISLKKVEHNEYGRISNREQLISREFDRSIKELLASNKLTYKKANKELKEKFNLKNYKYIIFKNKEVDS
jgi:hypothetical protein